MNKKNANNTSEQVKVKKPVIRTLLLRSGFFLLVITILLTFVCYVGFSRVVYSNYNGHLIEVINYVEYEIDAEDLKNCFDTKTKSQKYEELQLFLNDVVDNFEIKFLYIVRPTEEYLVNVISATSKEEFAAGEDNLPLGEIEESYDEVSLQRFNSFVESKEIEFFEETSDYGSFYTGVKALRTENGEFVALICADLLSDELHTELGKIVIYSLILSLGCISLLGAFIIIWMNFNVIIPVTKLETSINDFVKNKNEAIDVNLVEYVDPVITTDNEIQELSESIKTLASDFSDNIQALIKYENKTTTTEQENAILNEKAAASDRMVKLSESVSSLLKNMPSLSYTKDIQTGRYIACNQLFAEFAKKKNTTDVLGLTDYDIFDKKTADHFVKDDKKAIESDKPLVFYEDVSDAIGLPRQFQTTKLKFIDASGRVCLLGMSIDVTEMMYFKKEAQKVKEAYSETKNDIVTYSNIARALSIDYVYLFYVNIVNDSFIEYRSTSGSDDLVVERKGVDFFAASRRDAKQLLHVDDQKDFINSFWKDKILQALDERGSFTISYRLLEKGTPTYVSMKISRMRSDNEHIIVGVSNINEQMKIREESDKVKEEKLAYARITALSGNYICIYTVDITTDHYTEYSTSKIYEGLGIAKEGDYFFDNSRREGQKLVYHEDLKLFNDLFTKENILKEVKEHGMFSLNYRLEFDGVPNYINVKAAFVKELNNVQLIVGISNIDAQIKREQEYANKLLFEKNRAYMDALTGIKNKHAYIDEEAKLNQEIEENPNIRFALVVFDVNNLKTVNDTLGHQAGDKLIIDASTIIKDIFKGNEIYRVGGDEFVTIIREDYYNEIGTLMARINKHNTDNLFTENGILVACGMARFSGERSVAEVFKKADDNMYDNKKDIKRRQGEAK